MRQAAPPCSKGRTEPGRPLSPRSSLFAFVSRIHNDRNGVVDFAIEGVGATGRAGDTLTGTALGMRHNF